MTAKCLFDGILFGDDLPIMELFPCILTDFLDDKFKNIWAIWGEKKSNQLKSIYATFPDGIAIPSKECVLACTKLISAI